MDKILPTIASPADLRKRSTAELEHLAGEIRERIIEVVSANGGHLASNLGVVELTLALHRVFDFKRDRLLWDVGHQAYVHKLLTGRNARFDTLRKAGGISGFPNVEESEYDLFNVGHAGTAIATATGLARGAALQADSRRVVAVVGDASIFNGVAFEGLNQAGTLRRQLLVVLNDNSMGIAQTQGGMAEHLAKFRISSLYGETKKRVKKYLPQVPLFGKAAFGALDHLKEGLKATVSPHQIFEQLGFVYVGPTDGHDIAHLIELLQALKDVGQPVLLHVHTEKGRGAEWATAEPTKFHSPKPFKIEGCRVEIQRGGRSWTAAFADAVTKLAEKDKRIFALTAAMPDGTGLNKFQEAFPDRCLDGGIAESSTVDIAAGMCKAGLRPVVAIYSTFLQRAFDQVFQEVVLQGLPVIFCMDRAGLVGGDGAVHHGFLDIAYLRGMPNMVLMAPGDGEEIGAALALALKLDVPCAIRYPRDTVPEPLFDKNPPPFELGRSVTLREGDAATILAYGSTCRDALDAADLLAAQGVEVRVVNARFAKPVDRDMVREAFGTDPSQGNSVFPGLLVDCSPAKAEGSYGDCPPAKAGGSYGDCPPAKAGGSYGVCPPVKAGGSYGVCPPVKAGGSFRRGALAEGSLQTRRAGGYGVRPRPVITVEEHSVSGGFGSAVLETAQEMGSSAAHMTLLGMPRDRFIAHGSRRGQLAECGLDPMGIAAAVSAALEGLATEGTSTVEAVRAEEPVCIRPVRAV